MPTYETLMDAARRADAANDGPAAKRFLELARDARAVAPAQPEAPVDGGSALGAAITGAAQSVSLGGAEEAKAGLKAAWDWATGNGSFGDSYDKRLAETRGDLQARNEAHPYAATAGAVGGALLLPGGALKSGAGIAANAMRGAAAGGALGGAYGFGAGEGDAASRARSGLEGAGIGAVTGGIAGGALGKLEQGLTTKATNKAIGEAAANAPTPSENWAAGDAAFNDLRAKGIKFEDNASARLLSGVRDGLEGYDMDSAPSTLRRLNYLATKSDNGLSFSGLMNTRSALGKQAQNYGTSDGKAASVAIGKIDEFMNGVLDADVKSGGTAGLGEDWKQARSLWHTFKKSDRIAKAIESAKDAKGGVEAGLQSEFRKILKREKLTPAEKHVVREVLKGSTVGNFIRNNAGTVMGAIAGHAIGGPWGATAGAVAGRSLGRIGGRISEGASADAAQRALGFVANGSRFAQPDPVMLPGTGNALMRGSYGASNFWNR